MKNHGKLWKIMEHHQISSDIINNQTSNINLCQQFRLRPGAGGLHPGGGRKLSDSDGFLM